MARNGSRSPKGRRNRPGIRLGLILLVAGGAALPDLATAEVGYGPPATVSARFDRCGAGRRVTCVVDGDTIWVDGVKIRLASFNAPEVSEPKCAREAALGERATRRLIELLNRGPFALEPIDREYDRYGRTLRNVTRGGVDLGDRLIAEGLAERWTGHRGNWC